MIFADRGQMKPLASFWRGLLPYAGDELLPSGKLEHGAANFEGAQERDLGQCSVAGARLRASRAAGRLGRCPGPVPALHVIGPAADDDPPAHGHANAPRVRTPRRLAAVRTRP